LNIFGLFKILNFDVTEWYIDVWYGIWNYVKMWSRHGIFRKGNIVLRLLGECIALWCTLERDDLYSTGILVSYRLRVLGGESRKRFMTLFAVWK